MPVSEERHTQATWFQHLRLDVEVLRLRDTSEAWGWLSCLDERLIMSKEGVAESMLNWSCLKGLMSFSRNHNLSIHQIDGKRLFSVCIVGCRAIQIATSIDADEVPYGR